MIDKIYIHKQNMINTNHTEEQKYDCQKQNRKETGEIYS